MCARHIYANLKRDFPKQHDMKRLFWKLVESYTQQEYEANLEIIRRYDIRVYEKILDKNPKNCSIAFCSTKATCIDVHNNISESFNNAINPSRYLPMVEMLETIKKRAMIRGDQRMTKALRYQGRFTPRTVEIIELEQAKAIKFCRMIPRSDGRCEVLEYGQSVSINMRLQECACRRWQMSGVPCRHALRVILEKNLNREDYISSWYLNSTQQHIYNESIKPVNGMRFWDNSGSVILPPPGMVDNISVRRGRKPKPKRRRGRNESPTKKVTRKRKTMHCGRCGLAGHTVKKCSNIGVEINRPRRRATTTEEDDHESGYDEINLDFGERQSQQTQN